MAEKSKYLSVIFILLPLIAQAQFVHPGLLDSKEELLFMKEKIRNNEEPWKTGYKQIPIYLNHKPQPVAVYKDGPGHSDPEDIYNQQLNRDGEAAYASAIHWIVTQDDAHANKAAEILNEWAQTIKEIKDNGDGSLSTSYNWPRMIYAAEILKYTYDGWSRDNRSRFENVLRRLVWPATEAAMRKGEPGAKIGGSLHNNWTSMAIMCRVAIAIHTDDKKKYQNLLPQVRAQIKHYIYPSGQCVETARDLWHSQMGMAPLVAACEMAWHQGDNLYSTADNRLLRGIEWHIPYIMKDNRGWPTPEELNSPYYKWDQPDNAGEPWYFYEMVYNHYHYRLGLEAPNNLRILTESVTDDNKFPARPEKQSRTGGWGTATHARIAKK